MYEREEWVSYLHLVLEDLKSLLYNQVNVAESNVLNFGLL